jgi:membrane fusion protein, multidrug efflux system
MIMKNLWLIVGLVIAFTGCSGSSSKESPGTPVIVAKVQRENVPVYAEAFGKLQPLKKAKIIAKVEGDLVEAPLDDGIEVEKGELLFRINCEVYEAKVQKAAAKLQLSQADLDFSKRKLNRYRTLQEKEYITELSIEEMEREVSDYEAEVTASEAELDLAKLDLSHCDIYAPISGILGEQKVGTHNYVERGTLLTTIVQNHLLDVDFFLPEKFLVQLHATRKGKGTIPLHIYTQFNQKAEGRLTFVDNEVDPSTGTIRLRGQVENSERELEAGQFARVSLQLKILDDATVLPTRAVQIGQEGSYIYLVSDDHIAHLMKVDPIYRTDTEVVVKEEIPAGTYVVTDGHLNIFDGSKVSFKGENL